MSLRVQAGQEVDGCDVRRGVRRPGGGGPRWRRETQCRHPWRGIEWPRRENRWTLRQRPGRAGRYQAERSPFCSNSLPCNRYKQQSLGSIALVGVLRVTLPSTPTTWTCRWGPRFGKSHFSSIDPGYSNPRLRYPQRVVRARHGIDRFSLVKALSSACFFISITGSVASFTHLAAQEVTSAAPPVETDAVVYPVAEPIAAKDDRVPVQMESDTQSHKGSVSILDGHVVLTYGDRTCRRTTLNTTATRAR